MNINKALGIKIKSLRKARGLTQEQLAESCNLSVHHISGMERGLHAPSIGALVNLSVALNAPIRDFFEAAPKKKKNEQDRSIDNLLKYLYKTKPSTIKFITSIAKRMKN